MKQLRINFEEVRLGVFTEVFEALEAGFKEFGIDFYLIGAFARDLWMIDNKALPERRTTLDLDLVVYIAEWQAYRDLKQYLQTHFGFRHDREPYRLHSDKGLILDLVPFGGIERDNRVFLEGNPPLELSVFGMREVIDQAVSVNEVFKIVTLPGLCIMKLIAWLDKPEWRIKDQEDFWYIAENYSEIHPDLLFEEPHLDLLENEDFDYRHAYCRILGRQMRGIIGANEKLAQIIHTALSRLTGGFSREEVEEMHRAEPEDRQIKRFWMGWGVKDGVG